MENEKKKVALLSVFAAIFLTGFKMIIGILTGSLGILSEALHSTLDLVAAVITYFSVSISDKPADREHNYGHGKIENFSALIETLLLIITSVWIVYEAIHRLLTGNTHIEVNMWSYVVVISAIIIDAKRSRALYKVAKKHNSQALEADALHFSTDIWSSAVVLFGLICANFGYYFADSVAALFVAVLVVSVSFKLGKKAIEVLLDTAPQDKVNMVEQKLLSIPEVKSFHGLKIRSAGADTFIKVNVHLDSELSLMKVHEICDKIEKEINNLINRSEVYIHAEPEHETHINSEKVEDKY
ncbi:cation diffusion facilitator family transporter [uncultured Bacteroides sp.]|uniref:cation diffusion facilitator family transporter n=1 Tax=uncultured Bacteroides sp. TaxID=162156 RepID=UPI002AAB8C42|nr:cation diffusion facilitator family transporter [uncultured Bacteroides sp.]